MEKMKKSIRKTLGALALTIGAVGQMEAQDLYTLGHGDVRVTYETNAASLFLHAQLDWNATVNGTNAGTYPNDVSFDPLNLVTVVPNDPDSRPAGSQWDFMGVGSGDPIWTIPQTQETNKPWLGFNTEDIKSSSFSGSVQFTLLDVVGPSTADMSVYSVSLSTPTVKWDTADGIGTDDVFTLPLNTHAHYNWAFTEPGLYEITMKVRATHKTAGVKYTTNTFSVEVLQ